MDVTEKKLLTPAEKQAQLLETVRKRGGPRRPWQKSFGWAKDDPYYEEAMKLGEEYRRSQREE